MRNSEMFMWGGHTQGTIATKSAIFSSILFAPLYTLQEFPTHVAGLVSHRVRKERSISTPTSKKRLKLERQVIPSPKCPYMNDLWVVDLEKYVPFQTLLSRSVSVFNFCLERPIVCREKHCVQSSTDVNGFARLAVDGDYSPVYRFASESFFQMPHVFSCAV